MSPGARHVVEEVVSVLSIASTELSNTISQFKLLKEELMERNAELDARVTELERLVRGARQSPRVGGGAIDGYDYGCEAPCGDPSNSPGPSIDRAVNLFNLGISTEVQSPFDELPDKTAHTVAAEHECRVIDEAASTMESEDDSTSDGDDDAADAAATLEL